MVGGGSRVYGILGDPVAHSLSPQMHNAAFRAAGHAAIYVPFPVRAAELPAAVAGLRAAGVAGLNVTLPHKEAMLALVDEVRPRARACGAVNTVIRTRRGFAGDNTDGVGFLAALAARRRDLRGATVLLVGAGGAARSVAWACLRAGCARLVIANRTPARAHALAAALADRRVTGRDLAALADPDLLGATTLIVNATSTGLGAGALPPLRWRATRRDALCCDLVYGRPTRFLTRARAAGRPTMDGTAMLLHQGAHAFALWTGRAAPLAAMRRALRRALAGR